MFFRSILSVDITLPEEKLDSALESAIKVCPDAILISLTDEKMNNSIQRERAKAAFSSISKAKIYSIAVLNHPRTRLVRSDLDAIVSADLKAVFLADVIEPQDVRDVAVLLREFELERGLTTGIINIFPIIGSARSLLRALEIASAAPRVKGLVLDIDAYARDVRARFEQRGPRFAWARGNVVAIARSLVQLPIIKGQDLEFRELANTGFEGAIFQDPKMTSLVNDIFEITNTELVQARAEISAFEQKDKGDLVARLDGSFVDEYKVRKSQQIIDPIPQDDL